MRLADLEKYDPITIQCHDNPDADTLGAAYGLYCYFHSKGKQVRMIYSGYSRIRKANLCMMLDKLKLPIEYVEREGQPPFRGLLITVDCQYGASNVTRFEAEHVAVIDHHRIEIEGLEMSRIQPDLGSCCALAELFRVSLDNLVRFDDQDTGLAVPPRGKHFFGSLTVGPEGQLFLPEKARLLFGIHTGDQLLLLGDEGRGLALLHQRDLIRFAETAGIFPREEQI